MQVNDDSEIFLVKARRCKRCGWLLTSPQAVADGYGHVCKVKTASERLAMQPLPRQMSLFPGEPEKEGGE